MVHDLRPLSHPERSIQSIYFRNWVPPLLRQCRHIITNSEFTASEIRRSTDVLEHKISVTSLGYDSDHFYASQVQQRLHGRPYLLHVGQAYPHKNIERLIHAFNMIAHRFPEVDLLLLGKPHPFETSRLKQMTSELGLSDRVFFKSYVPYRDLANWYRGALAFVYPSLWEGFGLPILEAMACGCPVLTSYGSGTEEVAGAAALLINPFKTESMASSLVVVLSETKTRSGLTEKGLARARHFHWDKTRALTSALFDTIV